MILTRLETWAMPGVPDLLVCDEQGNFHMVELKFTKSNVVELRPHQVSFLSKHKHASVWVLIKKQAKNTDNPEIYLYHGRQAVDLRMEGLAQTEPVCKMEQPVDWEKIWGLITST